MTELTKCTITNLRKSDSLSDTRLIKFTKAEPTAEYSVSVEQHSVASGASGFNACFLPVLNNCDNAIEHVGFDYNYRNSSYVFTLTDLETNTELTSGSAQEYYNVIKIINETVDVVIAEGIDNGDGQSGIVLRNVSDKTLKLAFSLNYKEGIEIPETDIEVWQEYEADYYGGVYENLTYKQISSSSFEVCLSQPSCSALGSTLILKKPTVDLSEKYIVANIKYESAADQYEQIQTLYYPYSFTEQNYTEHSQDFLQNLEEELRYPFESYANIYTEFTNTEANIKPLNNCIDNEGNVQFELEVTWINSAPTVPVKLFLITNNGDEVIRLESPADQYKSTVLNNFATQLVDLGFTLVSSNASKPSITISKEGVKSLYVVVDSNQYENLYRYKVDGSSWSEDEYFEIDGTTAYVRSVRPNTCTLGTKDPFRNFDGAKLIFKGFPLKSESPVNYTRVTITSVVDLGEDQLDFLTTFSNVNKFVFDTCDTFFRIPK